MDEILAVDLAAEMVAWTAASSGAQRVVTMVASMAVMTAVASVADLAATTDAWMAAG